MRKVYICINETSSLLIETPFKFNGNYFVTSKHFVFKVLVGDFHRHHFTPNSVYVVIITTGKYSYGTLMLFLVTYHHLIKYVPITISITLRRKNYGMQHFFNGNAIMHHEKKINFHVSNRNLDGLRGMTVRD